MNIKVCDACLLEGRLNPNVKYRYGLRLLKSPVHLCVEHKDLRFNSTSEQVAMLEEAERKLRAM